MLLILVILFYFVQSFIQYADSGYDFEMFKKGFLLNQIWYKEKEIGMQQWAVCPALKHTEGLCLCGAP